MVKLNLLRLLFVFVFLVGLLDAQRCTSNDACKPRGGCNGFCDKGTDRNRSLFSMRCFRALQCKPHIVTRSIPSTAMASTSAESAVPAESVPVEGNLKLRSLDDKEFLFPLKDVKKAAMLQTMIADLGLYSEEAMESQPVPLPSVGGDALECIVEWCRLHADEAPRSDEDRQIHRFNRNVAKEDVELFDQQNPRKKLADVINAAYFLDMPDLIDALVKYTANNLEGKTAEEMSSWLEIPLKKDERKTAADDQGDDDDDGQSSEKRERTDADQPGTSQQAREGAGEGSAPAQDE